MLAQLHNSQGMLNFSATMCCQYLLGTDTLADKSARASLFDQIQTSIDCLLDIQLEAWLIVLLQKSRWLELESLELMPKS